MRFRILGPVEFSSAGHWTRIGRRQERCVLAALLLEAGRVVPAERLIGLLWPAGAPPAAANALRTYVSRLRSAISADAVELTHRAGGYVLDVDRESVDVHRFDALVQRADTAPTPGDQAKLLRQALALWRGPALADVGPDHIRGPLVVGLDQRRRRALHLRIEADLADGRHGELLGELAELAAGVPLDENFAGQLMLARFRAGLRQESLAAYRTIARTTRAELGLEPSARLQQLHATILRDEAEPPAVPEPHRAPAQLPAVTAVFTGRAHQVRKLGELLKGNGVAIVSGAGGVGKTSLALRWAHQVRDAFPDGQLFVDLRGFGNHEPTRTVDALAGFLRALGVPAERVPHDQDEAASLYRTVMASRRILVVLDNAAAADQVRALLPGDGAGAVLITSRDRLSGLVASHGAARLDLDVLTEPEAVHLLRRAIGDRLVGERDDEEALARACGRLPLALCIAAAQLADSPQLRIGEYLRRLNLVGSLEMLSGDGDPATAVRATLDASYTRLTEPHRRMFRLLGLAPGPDISTAAAAALADLPPAETARVLGRLASVHLVTETAAGRYILLDLVRQFATEMARQEPEDDRDRAVRHVLGWYAAGADAAMSELLGTLYFIAQPSVAMSFTFTGHTDALAWLDDERANLVAAIDHSLAHGPVDLGWHLADTLRLYLFRRRLLTEWLHIATAAVASAVNRADPKTLAALHHSLGMAYFLTHRTEPAITHFEVAADLAEKADWVAGQATIRGGLGMIYQKRGEFRQALASIEPVLVLSRLHGLPQADVIQSNANWLRRFLGESRSVVTGLRETLAQLTDPTAAGLIPSLLTGLAQVECDLGELDAALGHLRTALTMSRERGFRDSETHALRDLAVLHLLAGDTGPALVRAQEAFDLATEDRDHHALAQLLNVRGAIRQAMDDADSAAADHRSAFDLAARIDSRYSLAAALVGLAAADCARGRLRIAETAVREALERAELGGYVALVAYARTTESQIHHAGGDDLRAIVEARAALALYQDMGNRIGAAHALTALGTALRASDSGAAQAAVLDAARILEECRAGTA